MLKVWHDDVRRPPDDDWIWCRTNQQVIDIASRLRIDVLSIDHDLGGSQIPDDQLNEDSDFWKLDGDETGVDLAKWLAENNRVPTKVIVHSMNPVGAKNIIHTFFKYGASITNAVTLCEEPFSR